MILGYSSPPIYHSLAVFCALYDCVPCRSFLDFPIGWLEWNLNFILKRYQKKPMRKFVYIITNVFTPVASFFNNQSQCMSNNSAKDLLVNRQPWQLQGAIELFASTNSLLFGVFVRCWKTDWPTITNSSNSFFFVVFRERCEKSEKKHCIHQTKKNRHRHQSLKTKPRNCSSTNCLQTKSKCSMLSNRKNDTPRP